MTGELYDGWTAEKVEREHGDQVTELVQWSKRSREACAGALAEALDDDSRIGHAFDLAYEDLTRSGDYPPEAESTGHAWMEPGVAYTMGDEGWESWEDPRANY